MRMMVPSRKIGAKEKRRDVRRRRMCAKPP
jgi:hypothetical protein